METISQEQYERMLRRNHIAHPLGYLADRFLQWAGDYPYTPRMYIGGNEPITEKKIESAGGLLVNIVTVPDRSKPPRIFT